MSPAHAHEMHDSFLFKRGAVVIRYTGTCKTCGEPVVYKEEIVMGIKEMKHLEEAEIGEGDTVSLKCHNGHRHTYTVEDGALK